MVRKWRKHYVSALNPVSKIPGSDMNTTCLSGCCHRVTEKTPIQPTAAPQTRHSGECQNPGTLIYNLIDDLLDTGIRRYDTVPVFKLHVHEQLAGL